MKPHECDAMIRCIHECYNDMEEYYYCDITGNIDFEPCSDDEDCFEGDI